MQVVCVKVFIGSINDSNFNGTAFFINENTLVTAKHVVINNNNKIYDKVYINEIPGAGYIYIDSITLCDRDIAILKVKRKFSIPTVLFSDSIKVKKDVNILGYFDGDAGIKNYNHTVSGYVHSEHTYELQNYISKGISGSPVFIGNNICAIAQARNKDRNLTYAIPIGECCSDFVKDQLEQAKKKNHIFIGTTYSNIDISIAKDFSEQLKSLGHDVFLAEKEDLVENIMDRLEYCKYFILFLSKEAFTSEMIMQEVRRIKKLQNSSNFPVIIPIRLNLDIDYNINYDLSKLIYDIEPFLWKDKENTSNIVKVLDKMISSSRLPRKSGRKLKLSETDIPLPNAPLRVPNGKVPFDSKHYIERKDDEECYNSFLNDERLIRIKAPNQYGKTSLLSRVVNKAKKNNHNIVIFNFKEFNESTFNSLEKLLDYICTYITVKLDIDIEDKVNKQALKKLSSNYRATECMRAILLTSDKSILIAIDDADKLFKYTEVSNDFFALIRTWHQNAIDEPVWMKLKIILSHSTDAQLGTKNINLSPFYNVGMGVELKPFQKDEIAFLSQKHGLNLTNTELDRFISFSGGHPFLSRKILFSMIKDKRNLYEILNVNDVIFEDHMRRYLWVLNKNKDYREILKTILNDRKCKDDDLKCYILESTGLIKNTLTQKPEFSCELYREFFYKHL